MDAAPLTRILIADDHEMVLDMVSHYLSRSAGMQVTTAGSLEGALSVIEREEPFDLVLLDLSMPGMNGLDGLRQVIDKTAGRPVAILTGNPVLRMVDDILKAGAAGILLKTTSARSLTNAIRFMQAGEQYVPVELLRTDGAARPAGGGFNLSETERTVLAELAVGRQNKEIALRLGIAEATVKMHVTAICRKLDARNRTQAVVKARDAGLA